MPTSNDELIKLMNELLEIVEKQKKLEEDSKDNLSKGTSNEDNYDVFS